jgi:hypothetical protein
MDTGLASTIRWCKKRHFLRHLHMKTIFLSRRAREKHRENSKNEWRFSQGFAGMVLPVTEFILDVLSHNETKSQQQQQ